MEQNFDLLSFAGLSKDEPFALSKPTTTDLRAIIVGGAAVSNEEICKLIANVVGEQIQSIPIDHEEESIGWAMQIRFESLATDFLLWAEPLSTTMRDDFKVGDGWVLALQTMLHPDDPLTHFSNLMRLIGSLDLDVHSICDIPTGRWFPMNIVSSLFIEDDIEPPLEVLWITRLVEAPEDEEPENRWAWISTHGLSRCQKVEIEMLGVPSVLSTEAIHVVDGIASLVFESPLPKSSESFSIGPDMSVSVVDYDLAKAMLITDMPGNIERVNPTAIVTRAGGEQLCPQEVLEQLRSTNAAIVKSTRSTKRQTAIAHRSWDTFVQAARSIGQSEHAACMVQIPFAHTEEEPREYLWFTVETFGDQQFTAKLAHQPMYASSMSEGHQDNFTMLDVTDWVVMTPVGPLGPNDCEAIEEFLTQIQS